VKAVLSDSVKMEKKEELTDLPVGCAVVLAATANVRLPDNRAERDAAAADLLRTLRSIFLCFGLGDGSETKRWCAPSEIF
jgi:hypothetical protein